MKICSQARTRRLLLGEGPASGLFLLFLLKATAEAQAQDFNYTTNNGTITITFYTGQGGNVSIPETINGLDVTAIANNMIWGWWPLDAPSVVAIPKSVTTIGSLAFDDFPGLTSITIDPANPAYSTLDGVLFDKLQTTLFRFPSGKSGDYQIPASVTNIGPVAFTGCSRLSNVSIPDGVASIERAPIGLNGVGAFSSSGLTSITIPRSMSIIPDYLCAGCARLGQVALPEGLKSIGEGAFWFCGNLSDVALPGSLTNIGASAFVYCTSLTSLTIPAKVVSIGIRALTSCSSLGAINVDADNMFYSSVDGVLFDKYATALVQYPAGKQGSYAIPSGITNIPSQAFYGCSNLMAITIPRSVVNIEGLAFVQCTSLKSVLIPEGIKELQYHTFDTCSSLTNVSIPNSITNIGEGVFDFCTSLVSVTIPSSVAQIGGFAFYGCNNLQAVYFKGDAPLLVPPFEAFSDAYRSTVYYLPGTEGWGSTLDGRPAVLWNPLAQTSAASFGVRQGRFGFNIAGTAEIPIVIEASTIPATGSWVPLLNGTLTKGLIYFSDPQWTNYPSRFYRIRSP